MPDAASSLARPLLSLAVATLLAACGDDPAGLEPLPSDTVVFVGLPATDVRQGEVVTLSARIELRDGTDLPGLDVAWSVLPAGAGRVEDDGSFVAYDPGAVRVAARVTTGSGVADTVELSVSPRSLGATVTEAGGGMVAERFTSDLWVHGSHAYTGTWGVRDAPGNTLYVWDLSTPAFPERMDSVVVDAITVNDVKVRSDGTLAVITHEGANDNLNGVTLLDLTDPAHPTVITRYTEGLTSGVHNVWIEGDVLYAVSGSLEIIDISDPASPVTLSSFDAGSSFIHDVYVRDGLAFVSHWNAGLVIVDVGNGVAGGSPANPVEVSRIVTEAGNVHNAWYWPFGDYVFVGEEDFGRPGVMHVVDVSNLAAPREVATFAVPGDTPHNFWMDEENQVLYLAWYSRGLRVLDVSGRLLGRLDLQGREYAASLYNGEGGGCPDASAATTCTWAPQLHEGRVYVSDMHRGLVVLDVEFP